MIPYIENITADIKKVRRKKPLIHNITNYVVMNFSANALLALGASPVMSHAVEEVEDMVSLSDALVINIGTLSDKWVEAMIKAGKQANKKQIPVILDPVGVGATPLRNEVTKELLREIDFSVIRGNLSEILAIGNKRSHTKGVDSVVEIENYIETAFEISNILKTTIAITGETDIVTNGKQLLQIENGHPLMQYVTGTGCVASAIIAACSAIDSNNLTAATAGLIAWNLAGEQASLKTTAPGSYKIALLDSLYNLKEEYITQNAKISKIDL